MAESYVNEGMLEVFLYESQTMLEQLEAVTLEKEDTEFSESDVNEIFRTMHTIKGSSAVMMYQNITSISHKLEDIFYYIRESHPSNVPQKELTGHILAVCDFIKNELEKISNGEPNDGDADPLIEAMENFIEKIKGEITDSGNALPPENKEQNDLKHYYITPENLPKGNCYSIKVFFKPDTDMSNVKAYTMVYSLKEAVNDNVVFYPDDIITNADSAQTIIDHGFCMNCITDMTPESIMPIIDHVAGVANIDIDECPTELYENPKKVLENDINQPGLTIDLEGEIPDGKTEGAENGTEEETKPVAPDPAKTNPLGPASGEKKNQTGELVDNVQKNLNKEKPVKQTFISVNVSKMDQLMDLIGELVIAEAVVLQNPDLQVPGLSLQNFQKAAGQLSKITSELQDVIMALRMMPLNNTFQKMKRIVHDAAAKLDKDVDFVIIGEDTEVDKNIIEHISDPIMHLVRNAVDHGIEEKEERAASGKRAKAKVTLEAKNENGKVWITVSDDGKGLDKEKLLKKARENGLLNGRNEKDMTDKEIYNLITLPGFSTKEQVTELSGRGVGMDVVVQNIQSIGGSLDIESELGSGSKMILKIPLTLAIVDGIIFGVGESTYVVATGDVREFVKVEDGQIIVEPEGAESLMIRGEAMPVLKLKEFYGLSGGVDNYEDGIMIILEHEEKKLALFVDKLVGEQEIVVKPIPLYMKKVRGLSGCTQLGDGSISLILDSGSLMKE